MRKKYYLFDLSDLFLSQFERPFQFQTFTKTESFFPKDDDKNFNKQVEESETETHKIKKETWVSHDGASKFTRTWSETKNPEPKIDVKLLESKLKEAIETENYELACKLRDQIKGAK